MPTAIPVFPNEIFDTIIDHLHNDKWALLRTCLVCRAWLPSSRYHQFRRVELTGTRRIANFLDILESPLSTILPFVRSLVLRESGWGALSSSRTWVPGEGWEPVSVVPKTALFALLRELHRLDIRQFHFEFFSQVVEMVSIFPVLEEVLLRRVHWSTTGRDASSREGVSPPGRELLFPPSLRFMELGDCPKSEVLDWLILKRCTPNLRTILLGSIAAAEINSINRYLQTLGPTLEHLTLVFCSEDSEAAIGALSHAFHYAPIHHSPLPPRG
jgi:hypothetical protein